MKWLRSLWIDAQIWWLSCQITRVIKRVEKDKTRHG